MGQDTGQGRTQQLTDEQSAEQLRAEIEETRADLGDTAAALAAKTDVKARARTKAEEVKRSALNKVGRDPAGTSSSGGSGGASVAIKQARTKAEQNPVLVAAIGALLGGIAIGRLTRR
jgi:hypothetical protein